MTVPVTELPIAKRHVTGSGGSVTAYCTAQSNVSFLQKHAVIFSGVAKLRGKIARSRPDQASRADQ